MKYIDGGVCAAKGFKATGLNAGIKNNVKKIWHLFFRRHLVSKREHSLLTEYVQLRSSGTRR